MEKAGDPGVPAEQTDTVKPQAPAHGCQGVSLLPVGPGEQLQQDREQRPQEAFTVRPEEAPAKEQLSGDSDIRSDK